MSDLETEYNDALREIAQLEQNVRDARARVEALTAALREVTFCGHRVVLAVETGDAIAAEFNKALIHGRAVLAAQEKTP